MTEPQYAMPQYPTPENDVAPAQKSFVATWLLAWFLGWLGIDRFYLGKIGTGILKLVTVGGLGIWSLIDVILVLCGVTRDKAGRPLEGYDQHKKVAWIISIVLFVLGLISGVANGIQAANTVGQLGA